MSKIQLSQRMYSVRDINRLLQSKEMAIQPKYQRRRQPWPPNAQTALIDTVLNNFPIPPVYLRDYVTNEGRRQKEIIDGQQRISIITGFYNDMFVLSNNIFDPEFKGCKYSQLPEEDQMLIEDFEVSFISIRGALEGDVVSIFSRLNSFSLPLNSQEKRNSKFAGEIKTIIYELATEYNTFWMNSRVLSTAQIARMHDALLVSELIYTILYGYQAARSAALDKMYKDFDEEFPHKRHIYDSFNKTVTILGNLFEIQSIQRVFKPKFMFYTLFLVIYARLFGFEGKKEELTGSIDLNSTKNKLMEFSTNYLQPDYEPLLKSKMKQATGNPGQRKFRHEVISKLVI
ncbi:DUF262 domain-containing protein [Thermodesulfobacteriota bacterium]